MTPTLVRMTTRRPRAVDAPSPEPQVIAMTEPREPALREIPVDWEALEDAFENNAPEVHSYLHLGTGEVLRVVDGIADPEMHTRIAQDAGYLRVEPVSSREQYRWMERFIPMVEDVELRDRLGRAIDGKGAFRRFKDVLMAYAPDRERWFAFRSERLRVFMEAWLAAHQLVAIARKEPVSSPEAAIEPVPAADLLVGRRARPSESLKRQVRDVIDQLGARDLEKVLAFAEFVRARRGARTHASDPASTPPVADTDGEEESTPSSRERRAAP